MKHSDTFKKINRLKVGETAWITKAHKDRWRITLGARNNPRVCAQLAFGKVSGHFAEKTTVFSKNGIRATEHLPGKE